MEVSQADQVESEKATLMGKGHFFSLASTKVVYARDQDPADTMILRNLYPKIKEHQKLFGLKEVSSIEKLFISILWLYKQKFKKLKKRVKNVSKQEFEEVQMVILEMEETLERTGTFAHNAIDDDGDDAASLRFKVGMNFVNVRIFAKTEFPYLSLCNEDSGKKYINSTNLFIGEGIKLLRYLNMRFNFVNTEHLKMNQRDKNLFKTDDFFKFVIILIRIIYTAKIKKIKKMNQQTTRISLLIIAYVLTE